MFHIHSWERWRVNQHYIDISYGDRVPSTEMLRACKKCGLVQTKDYYGSTIPFDKE